MGNLNFSFDDMKYSFYSIGILGNMFKFKYNLPNSIYWQIDQIKNTYGAVNPEYISEALDLELKFKALNNTGTVFNTESFPFTKMMDTIHNIYGQDGDRIIDYANMYDRVQTDIITDYIGIGELRKFYTPYYLFIEWQMHMEWKDKGKMHSDWNFYRDHWIHQIRVMYSSIELLNTYLPTDDGDQSLIDVIIKKIKNSSINIDKYIDIQANKEHRRINDTPSLKNLFTNLFKYELAGDVLLSRYNQNTFQEYFDDNLYNYIVRYILNSAVMLAGIFHDIGYPIQHVRTHRHSLQKVVINAPIFGNLSSHFHDFEDDLSTSLLFQIVDRDDMKPRFDNSDHGLLSALAFLMFMHENGLIYQLHPAQQAAVELAALVIYDHTNIYIDIEPPDKMNETAAKTKYQSPVFMRNPLSYIVRFCDDIQEWDRMYFNIGKDQSLKFCIKCKKPIVEDIMQNENYIFSENKLKNTITQMGIGESEDIDNIIHKIENSMKQVTPQPVFKCACCKIKTSLPIINSTLYDNSINHRDLDYINASNMVSLYEINKNAEADDENLDFLPHGYTPVDRVQSQYGAFILNIDYDPWKLIELSLIEPTFSIHRAKEVNRTRRYLKYQGNFPRIIVHSVPTQNPITQKVRLLENFIKLSRRIPYDSSPPSLVAIVKTLYDNLATVTPLKEYKFEHINKRLEDFYPNTKIKKLARDIFDFENIGKNPSNINSDIISNDKNSKLDFYLSLLITSRLLGRLYLNISLTNEQNTQISNDFCNEYPDLVKSFKDKTGSGALEYLIKDFYINELRHVDYYTFANNIEELPNKYYEMYKEDISQHIKNYTLPCYYLHTFESNAKFLDMHSDLYFFKLLSEQVILYTKLIRTTKRHINNFLAT